jgi:hypothetical protein
MLQPRIVQTVFLSGLDFSDWLLGMPFLVSDHWHRWRCNRCILSKCYSAALPVLEAEVYEVDPSKTAMTVTDFLLCCYYGGMIHTGAQ